MFRAEQGIDLPEPGKYATGMLFVDKDETDKVKVVFTRMAEEFHLKVGCVTMVIGGLVECPINGVT
jgi:glutamate synthase domain-containing protein 1